MTAAAQGFVGRRRVVTGAFALAFAGLGARVVQIASEEGAAPARSAGPTAPPVRADVVDRDGAVLATSMPAASITADPVRIADPEATAARLAALLPDVNERRLARALADRDRRFVWVARGVTPRQRQAVFDAGVPGVGFREEARRAYPRGTLAAHALGLVDVDGRGLSGVEAAYDALLTAPDATALRLSLSLPIQHALEATLDVGMTATGAKRAAVIAMDPTTGEILALASRPGFDPHAPGRARQLARTNHALASRFELGSVMKVATYAQAMDAGASLADPAPDGDAATLAEAFAQSDNAAAAALALRQGAEDHRAFLTRMGLLASADVGLAESAAPLAPPDWRDATRESVSRGYALAVSPLAFAAAACATVNGGRRVVPSLVRREAALGPRVLSESASAKVRALLAHAVTHGTGRRAARPGLSVGGKTGTAWTLGPQGYDPDAIVASFVGVTPVDRPRLLVFALLDRPQTGLDGGRARGAGSTAAPLVGEMLAKAAPLRGIAPDPDADFTLAAARG